MLAEKRGERQENALIIEPTNKYGQKKANSVSLCLYSVLMDLKVSQNQQPSLYCSGLDTFGCVIYTSDSFSSGATGPTASPLLRMNQ